MPSLPENIPWSLWISTYLHDLLIGHLGWTLIIILWGIYCCVINILFTCLSRGTRISNYTCFTSEELGNQSGSLWYHKLGLDNLQCYGTCIYPTVYCFVHTLTSYLGLTDNHMHDYKDSGTNISIKKTYHKDWEYIHTCCTYTWLSQFVGRLARTRNISGTKG